jgi:hypothetical protein
MSSKRGLMGRSVEIEANFLRRVFVELHTGDTFYDKRAGLFERVYCNLHFVSLSGDVPGKCCTSEIGANRPALRAFRKQKR